MPEQALGMIETRGLIPCIEAADTMLKAAEVSLQGLVLVGGALATVMVRGEVSAVKAAVDAGAETAQRVGELISKGVISRPDNQVPYILPVPRGSNCLGFSKKETSGRSKAMPALLPLLSRRLSEIDLGRLSVIELRKLARKAGGLKIKGREISRANKLQLIEALCRSGNHFPEAEKGLNTR